METRLAFVVTDAEQKIVCRFTLERSAARERADLDLLGLDHPPEQSGVSVSGAEGPGVLSWWLVETRGPSGEHRASVLPLGVHHDGKRNVRLERLGAGVFARPGYDKGLTASARTTLLREHVEPTLERELQHRKIVPDGGSYAAKLISWSKSRGRA